MRSQAERHEEEMEELRRLREQVLQQQQQDGRSRQQEQQVREIKLFTVEKSSCIIVHFYSPLLYYAHSPSFSYSAIGQMG